MSVMQAFVSANEYALICERDEAIRRSSISTTIAIPCYQQVEYLRDALRTATDQMDDETGGLLKDVEVIVVDDGSPTQGPDIAAMCEQYGARYVRVTNRGLPSARNTGLMLAAGEWFVPLDADDWIDKAYVWKMRARARETGAHVVIPGLQEHGETRNGTYMPGFDRALSDVTLDVMWEFNRTFYCSLFKTELLRSVGGWNGRMVDGLEDYDLAIDLMVRKAKYAALNEVLFHYRTRNDSMLTQTMKSYEQIKDEMRRHHNR